MAGLPTVATDEPQVLAAAIDWLREGMDFADALHLAKAQGCEAFLSFDRKLAKAARGRSAVRVGLP